MRINNDFIIGGVDAGYGNMKTANIIFPTGLAAMDTKPYFDGDIMHYNGRWYRIGEGHKAFKSMEESKHDELTRCLRVRISGLRQFFACWLMWRFDYALPVSYFANDHASGPLDAQGGIFRMGSKKGE